MARRILGVAMAIRDAGYEVLVGAGQFAEDSGLADAGSVSFPVEALGEMPRPSDRPLAKAFRHLTWGANTLRWLNTLNPRPDVVIIYGGYSPYAARLLPWCRRNGVALIVDVVEWYQPSHVAGGALGPLRCSVELGMRHYYPRVGAIIAISRYLQDYYMAKGCNVVRVPPTLDVLEVVPGKGGRSDLLTLAYTGVSGRKDLLDNVVEAVLRIDPDGRHLCLVAAGPTADDLLRMPALRSRNADTLPAGIQAHGRVSHVEALRIVGEADFTVLLRPPLRYAQAGFPTKVPESLASGTPVICNLTSDLELYVRDGETGLICADHSVEAVQAALIRAMAFSEEAREAMRHAARAEAEAAFDYRRYVEPLGRFGDEAIRSAAS